MIVQSCCISKACVFFSKFHNQFLWLFCNGRNTFFRPCMKENIEDSPCRVVKQLPNSGRCLNYQGFSVLSMSHYDNSCGCRGKHAVCKKESQAHPQPGKPGAADFVSGPPGYWLQVSRRCLDTLLPHITRIVVLPGESFHHLVVKQKRTGQRVRVNE